MKAYALWDKIPFETLEALTAIGPHPILHSLDYWVWRSSWKLGIAGPIFGKPINPISRYRQLYDQCWPDATEKPSHCF